MAEVGWKADPTCCSSDGTHAPIPDLPAFFPERGNPTLSGHSAQRRDSCNVVTFQMEVMRLHPAAISNRPFAPLQPSLWSRSEVPRHRRSPLLPSTARHRQILALSQFSRKHSKKADCQSQETRGSTDAICRIFRSGKEDCLYVFAIIGGRARKQGPGSAHNNCDWSSRNAHIL